MGCQHLHLSSPFFFFVFSSVLVMQYYSTFVHCNFFSPQASQHLALLQLFSWSKKGVLGAGVCSTWWNVQGATEMWKIWWPAHSHGRTCQFLCGIIIYAKVWQFCFENYVNLFFASQVYGRDIRCTTVLPWKEGDSSWYKAREFASGIPWRAENCWFWLVCPCTFSKVRKNCSVKVLSRS